MNLALLLDNAARSFADRPAVSIGALTVFDYAELARRTSALAGAISRVASPGDRIAIAAPNCAEYLELLYSVWRSGCVAAPLNAQLSSDELAYAVNDCEARLVFAHAALAEKLSGKIGPATVVEVGGKDYNRMLKVHVCDLVQRSAEDPAWIFYTSGTTGKPKGAVLTHGNLTAMLMTYFADIDHLNHTDALLHLAATSHASGLFALSHVAKASNNILPESGKYNPAELAEITAAIPNLTFFVPPTVLRRMVDSELLRAADLGNIKTVIVGAAPVYENDIRKGLSLFGPKLWNGYGQGESPCTITAMSKRMIAEAAAADDTERLSSVGVARTGIEVGIASADSENVGEVIARGATVMSGYWRNADATRAALKDGWLRTGDLGRLDAAGYLTLLDRRKDMIISGGQNIYAREVEDLLLSNEAVEEVAVIGAPDKEWGERVVAVVVAPGAGDALAGELDRLCLEKIARYKRPRRYEFLEALPKNAAGKVLKSALRDRFATPS